jgi:DNA-binding transcriptional regulator YiaG
MKPKEIITLRKRLGLTQGALAAEIGASRETVSRWESGKHPPEGANLKALRDLAQRKGRHATTPKAK